MRGLLVLSGTGLLIAVVLAGCSNDDPVRPHLQPPFTYPALDTPQHVLLNVKYAWERRDTIRTKQVYDDLYVGSGANPDDPGIPYTFSKDQEVGVVAALAQDASVVSTRMDLRPESTWVRMHFDSDPEGWATIMLLTGARLEVETDNTTFTAGGSDITFKFKPYLDTASATDTTWKVVRWTETLP